MPRDRNRKHGENDTEILKAFDTTFDAYNTGRMTKERMIKNCFMLYKKLTVPFPELGLK